MSTEYIAKKIYTKTEEGEKLISNWTSAHSVELSDGKLLNNKIDEFDVRVSQINVAQKTVNNLLEYGCFSLTNDMTNQAGIDIVPFDKTICFNKLQINNGIFSLTGGKTYKIHYELYGTIPDPGTATYGLYNTDNAIFINNINSIHTNLKTDGYECIYTPDVNINLCIRRNGDTYFTSVDSTYSYLLVEEICKSIQIDPLEYVDEAKGIQDTPVGHIISHIGTTAPPHYLVCDGAAYNISDYPYLAEHFKSEFGVYNHFGGDGITTFSLPDLRNEFLRGYHGEASTLSGNIGEHQDGTKHTAITNYAGYIHVGETVANCDKVNIVDWANVYNRSSGSELKSVASSYISRPSNVAVLFCMKYEPTYYMKNTYGATELYSLDEQLVGRWIDGKYVYKKSIYIDSLPNTGTKKIATGINDIEKIIKLEGICDNDSAFICIPYVDATNIQHGIDAIYLKEENVVRIITGSDRSGQSGYITLFYTKTTDNILRDYPNLEINESIYTDEEVTQMTNNVFGGEI